MPKGARANFERNLYIIAQILKYAIFAKSPRLQDAYVHILDVEKKCYQA
jgi:hypothetical protein